MLGNLYKNGLLVQGGARPYVINKSCCSSKSPYLKRRKNAKNRNWIRSTPNFNSQIRWQKLITINRTILTLMIMYIVYMVVMIRKIRMQKIQMMF